MKISTVLCTYNGERYLPEQLESISTQTRVPDELIICDDCSSDKTPEIVSAFASRAPFPVRFFINDENLGSTRNFEKAIKLSEGDIIVLADQDDIWLPPKLERFEQIFLRSAEVGLVFSDAELVAEDLRPLGSNLWNWTVRGEHRHLLKANRIFDILVHGNIVTGATMAFRSRFRELVLPVPGDRDYFHDGWIALLIASVAEAEALPESLIKYRQHPNQQLGLKDLGLEDDSTQATKRIPAKAKNAAERALHYDSEIENIRFVRQRLEDIQHTFDQTFPLLDARVSRLKELEAHYQVRGHIPDSRVKRVPFIFNEMMSGRYHTLSKGFLSIALDLLR